MSLNIDRSTFLKRCFCHSESELLEFNSILQEYSRFAITRVIVHESSYLFLTEGMYTSGYIIVNVTKRLKNLNKTMYSYSNKIRFNGIILFSFLYRPLSVDSMRSVFLFHILNDRDN